MPPGPPLYSRTAALAIREVFAMNPVLKTNHSPDVSLEELLAFERLLSDLSARFANIAGGQVVAEIEIALGQLLAFLGFDRSSFSEFTTGKLAYICAGAIEGVDPLPVGPLPVSLNWFEGELLTGRTIAIRSYEDFPPEAAAAAEYYRRVGIRSQLVIPLSVGGDVVAAIGFGSFRHVQKWPDHFVARLKVIGGVMAQALARRRSEAALRAAHSELARVSQLSAMGAMAASIAHEIRQPLAAMTTEASASLRWLAKSPPDLDEVRKSLYSIVSNGHRANDILEAIRAMFKNDPQEIGPVDLYETIREVLAFVYQDIQRQTISVKTELTDKLPQVYGNRTQLQQVVSNLLMNAIEAMASITDRPRVLRLKLEAHLSDGVLIAVQDTGVGIAPENIERIFDPLFTTKSRGMGMGLSICRSIIEAHHGRLWASAAHPLGSIFQVILPTGRPGDA